MNDQELAILQRIFNEIQTFGVSDMEDNTPEEEDTLLTLIDQGYVNPDDSGIHLDLTEKAKIALGVLPAEGQEPLF
jgi:hypothetical protein